MASFIFVTLMVFLTGLETMRVTGNLSGETEWYIIQGVILVIAICTMIGMVASSAPEAGKTDEHGLEYDPLTQKIPTSVATIVILAAVALVIGIGYIAYGPA